MTIIQENQSYYDYFEKKLSITHVKGKDSNIPKIAYAILNQDFRVACVNQPFAELFQKPRSFFQGKTFFQLFPVDRLRKNIAEIIKKDLLCMIPVNDIKHGLIDKAQYEILNFTFRSLKPDGIQSEFILLTIISVNDIRLQNKGAYDELVHHVSVILDSIHDGVNVISPQYEIEFANAVILNDFGEINNQRCYQYFYQRDRICPNCDLPKILSGETVSFEQIFPSLGKTFDVLDLPIKNPDGSISKFRVMHDISRLKKSENDLLQANLAMQAKTYEEMQHRYFAEALGEVSKDLNKSLDIDVVLSRIMKHVKDSFEFVYGSILLFDRNNHSTWHKHYVSFNQQAHVNIPDIYPLDEQKTFQELFESKEIILIEDIRSAQGWETFKDWEWVRSFLSVPIDLDGEIKGIIYFLGDDSVEFSANVVNRASAFASQAAIAIQNAELFEKLSERNERLQLLSQHQEKILEEERQYIARELHDEAGQSLTKLILDLHLLEQQIDDPESMREEIHKIEDSLVSVSKSLHHVAMTLRPASLDRLGLLAAITQLVDSLNQTHRLKIKIKSNGLQERFPNNIETIIYRFVQEALTNVIRHADATQATVRINEKKPSIHVEVQDNGVGFDPDSVIGPSHLGLLGIQERIQNVGGAFMIESAPNQGTRVLVEVDFEDQTSYRR